MKGFVCKVDENCVFGDNITGRSGGGSDLDIIHQTKAPPPPQGSKYVFARFLFSCFSHRQSALLLLLYPARSNFKTPEKGLG